MLVAAGFVYSRHPFGDGAALLVVRFRASRFCGCSLQFVG